MTTAAKPSFGAQLWMAPSGQTLVMVAELISVEPPKMTRQMLDATTHDSSQGAEEVIPSGTFKPGELKAKVNYIMNSAGDLAMRSYAINATKIDWKVVAKSSSGTGNQQGSGYVGEYGPNGLETEGLQEAELNITASGPVSQS